MRSATVTEEDDNDGLGDGENGTTALDNAAEEREGDVERERLGIVWPEGMPFNWVPDSWYCFKWLGPFAYNKYGFAMHELFFISSGAGSGPTENEITPAAPRSRGQHMRDKKQEQARDAHVELDLLRSSRVERDSICESSAAAPESSSLVQELGVLSQAAVVIAEADTAKVQLEEANLLMKFLANDDNRRTAVIDGVLVSFNNHLKRKREQEEVVLSSSTLAWRINSAADVEDSPFS